MRAIEGKEAPHPNPLPRGREQMRKCYRTVLVTVLRDDMATRHIKTRSTRQTDSIQLRRNETLWVKKVGGRKPQNARGVFA